MLWSAMSSVIAPTSGLSASESRPNENRRHGKLSYLGSKTQHAVAHFRLSSCSLQTHQYDDVLAETTFCCLGRYCGTLAISVVQKLFLSRTVRGAIWHKCTVWLSSIKWSISSLMVAIWSVNKHCGQQALLGGWFTIFDTTVDPFVLWEGRMTAWTG